ncbi:putative beta-galactosidase B [Gracilariopsis chorda]|uniref:beta-galactosidase n=1 Tax=Gracilariopsis chorda TaxID=448386 RepID=A0A2V3IHE3_9FLOR|nr:putative beta-galactosidase B [Gracilariopsis chorda]|eukprot:PXF41536.1 putative beta-galactosidase B [Gracilariopsis chorda]
MSLPTALHLRSNEQTAFEPSRFSSVIDWTKTALLLNGKPVTIISAEFHYFRVPDHTRWRRILADIKGMGFNTVRFYIHWGYHSPCEGVYNFRGNRDIIYLLNLCVELQLFVIVAPGPYICAEVQAGGFPIWLIANRNLRVRHMTFAPLGMIKKWDQQWHEYCAGYMTAIVKMLVPFERTTNPNGCIIAMQIENELREMPVIGFGGGCDDEIRLLCNLAREAGSTVPFFHNDDSPIGSWSNGDHYRSFKRVGARSNVKAYRTDLYGFDLYFTFPPGDRSGDLSSCQVGMLELFGVSACLNCCGIGGSGVGGSDQECLSCLYEKQSRHAPPPPLSWATANQMESAVDTLEAKFEKFGGSATHGPPVLAEAQVGWINQWGRMRTYDDVYNFFGDQFSATFQFSLMAQGVSFVNHYAAYGGTNHGTIGDTEVYTSYDYSAFIREFGLLSGRGRIMRLANLFARSFSDVGLPQSLPTTSSSRRSKILARVKATVPRALLKVRQVGIDDAHVQGVLQNDLTPFSYAFVRNLHEEMLRFNLIVDNLVLPVRLKKCESFAAPLFHDLTRTFSIFACTVPVICRTTFEGSEMWVLRVRPSEVGRIVLNVVNKNETKRHALDVKWAKIHNGSKSGVNVCGEISVTDQDPGAATSLLSAPLEELPLAEQNSFATGSDPVGVKASTEDNGICFSFSFAMDNTHIVTISEVGGSDADKPLLRLLCLTETDSRTFTARLNGNDNYSGDSTLSSFAAAWGVSNLTFMPDAKIDVGLRPQDEGSTIYVLQHKSAGVPEMFEGAISEATQLVPGLSVHHVAPNSISAALSQGWNGVDPLSKSFEIPIENLTRRAVDWMHDTVWKRIAYQNIDPLDHLMTSGHIAYRIRFRSTSTKGAIIANVRHSAVIWCNGKAVGDQVCFSHNFMSAGAMHGVDLPQAGKKRHDLSAAMSCGPDQDGFHEVIILVLSLGQGRSPFLLNDVRNKRGLLSARFSRSTKAGDISWEIGGTDVTRYDDAYGSSGLPLEDEANTSSFGDGFVPVPSIEVKADAGVVYYRGTFRVPAASILGGTMRFPLRIRVLSGAKVRVMLWVNTLFMGRYVEPLGPQRDFYVPEGLITDCKGNNIVLAVYGSTDTNISVSILPWIVDMDSGNLNDNGEVYALKTTTFALSGTK